MGLDMNPMAKPKPGKDAAFREDIGTRPVELGEKAPATKAYSAASWARWCSARGARQRGAFLRIRRGGEAVRMTQQRSET